METIISIIEFQSRKYHGIGFSEALDIFCDSVEQYKHSIKRKRLECVAKVFMNACLVAGIDNLSGAQCFEVFNNLCTDMETDKETLEKAINKLVRKEKKDYERNKDNCLWTSLVRMRKRHPRK